ncbi:MAG TPA: ribose-phosphate pyrophosphokinase [Chloroflexi bacterium]|jgi:ribose-phosphate pyrophosphokinase|nr:ribose-phosphate pyrophosphokinase [Chloroflexota bacterium]
MLSGDTASLSHSLRIFSGSSHPELAKEIADYLGCRLCWRQTERFSNDNIFVHLGESVRGKEVVIIQSFTPDVSDHILELLMLLDTARSASAKTIHAVIPYYSYARSDKKDQPRISIAGRLIADLLATAGANHVMTMTLHSPQVHGFFSVPTDHLTAHTVFVRYLQNRDLSNTVVVAPDIGHAKRAAKLAKALGVPVAAGDKERLTDERVRIAGIIGDITGKDCILFDDEVATGGSVVALIDELRRHKVEHVTLACTHGVFSGPAIERLAAIPELDEIVTTNTVPIPPERRLPNMTVLSVAPIFGEAIRRNILGQSVGQLFAYWPDSDDGPLGD